MNQPGSRVAVVTGASSGIGKSAAKLLAAQGWHIIGHGRDPERCNAALAEISEAAAPGVRVTMLRCDLALLSETAAMAAEIARLTPRVDVLLNNAGGMRSRMHVTEEGNEATFAGNHLGHFLLTKRMMPLLRNTAQACEPGAVRVISVSSSGHEYCSGLDWNDLQQTAAWDSSKNYCLAKLCNLLFTLELSERVKHHGIVAHAMHPGVVNSNFHAHATAELQRHMQVRPGDRPDKSAATLAWLATDSDVGSTTGGYFHDMTLVPRSAAALDRETAARLWTESEALLVRSGY